jgi:NADH-quinone oxidoreductase subunit C
MNKLTQDTSAARSAALELPRLCSTAVSDPVEFRGEISVTVADPAQVIQVLEQLKNALGFDMLLDVSSVDLMGEKPRFIVVYELFSLAKQCHLRVSTRVEEAHPVLPSCTRLWKAADWHEREIYDMMGIRFEGHPDLRRILMWEGYPYNPLRKDFPLAGRDVESSNVASAHPAALEGGPFVTTSGTLDATLREPRSHGE